jgi:hypothetical protein
MDFKTEDLVVDWVGFNLCGCDNYSSIASYLFELNFNIIEKLDHFTQQRFFGIQIIPINVSL